jgi:hypothetical protein
MAEKSEGRESGRRSTRVRTRHPRGVFFPLLLVGLGIILMLNTLGVLEVPILPLLTSLWPVLLVLIGLDILIGGRSAVGNLLASVVLVALLAGAVFFASLSASEYGSLTHEQIGRPIHAAAEELDATVVFGAGELDVSAMSAPEDFAAEVDFRPVTGRGMDYSYEVGGGQGMLYIADGKEDPDFDWWTSRSSKMSVALPPDMPISLDALTGVGAMTLDLTELEIEALEAEVGVGELIVKLPEEGDFEADLSAGIGQVTVVVPDGMEARVEHDVGIGNLDIDEGRFVSERDSYVTRGFADADSRVVLTLDVGIGEIVVR